MSIADTTARGMMRTSPRATCAVFAAAAPHVRPHLPRHNQLQHHLPALSRTDVATPITVPSMYTMTIAKNIPPSQWRTPLNSIGADNTTTLTFHPMRCAACAVEARHRPHRQDLRQRAQCQLAPSHQPHLQSRSPTTKSWRQRRSSMTPWWMSCRTSCFRPRMTRALSTVLLTG